MTKTTPEDAMRDLEARNLAHRKKFFDRAVEQFLNCPTPGFRENLSREATDYQDAWVKWKSV